MNIPKLTAFIGENNSNQQGVESLIKEPKIKLKEGETPYVIFLLLDLIEDKIDFLLGDKFKEQDNYNYFGNNSAASSQFYLTRDLRSLHYLLTKTFNDLSSELKKYNMENGELGGILKDLNEKGLITDEGLNLSKFKSEKGIIVRRERNHEKIYINGQEKSPQDLIRLFIEDATNKDKFILIVPKVKCKDGKEVILSQHPEYLELVKREKNLNSNSEESTEKKGKSVCYICGREVNGVSSEYSKSFSRMGINKIFITTDINYAPNFKRENYDNLYAVCQECYQKLLSGEKIISDNFKSKIAGEDVFLLPEGIISDFKYEYLKIIKKDVDLAFKTENAKEWIDTVEEESNEEKIKEYNVNFIFHRTDGKSLEVLETIEDIPDFRLKKIINLFERYSDQIRLIYQSKSNINFSLGSIYRIIPVKVNKNNEQINIGRILSFYKSILMGEKIDYAIFYDYATEALDIGLKQLAKSSFDNYYNMQLGGYKEKTDFFIKDLIFKYIVLIKSCQELKLMDRGIFKLSGKGKDKMGINTPSKGVNFKIDEIEKFLNGIGFREETKALFYLGILINKVGNVQYSKEHKSKPILKKIQFQGMNEREIYDLYLDTIEKLTQYEKLGLYPEAVMNRFHYYYEPYKGTFLMNEKQNVFYIMAGYSYNVGNKTDETEKEETE